MAIDQTEGAEFERVVDTIIGAKKIYIVGFRSSSFLAGYLNFYFRLIFENVVLVQGGAPLMGCKVPSRLSSPTIIYSLR